MVITLQLVMPKKKEQYRNVIRDGVVGKYIKKESPPEIPSKCFPSLCASHFIAAGRLLSVYC